MTVLARNRHRRTGVMLAINLSALVALGGVGYAGLNALRNYEGAKNVTEAVRSLTPTTVGMLGLVDDDDALVSVAVVVLHPASQGARGGSIVPVPVSADTALGVGGLRIPLTQVYAEGGAEALVTGVENVLSITLEHSAVVTRAEGSALFNQVGPISATLPAGVVDMDAQVLWPAGEVSLGGEQFVQALTARAEGSLDRDRRAIHWALWEGLAATVGSGRTGAADPVQVGTAGAAQPAVESMADLMERLFAGPIGVRGINVVPLAAGEAPDGVDVEMLDFTDAVMVFGSVAPSAMSASRDALVYRIEAPPGYDAQVRWATELVLYFGFNVQSVYIGADIPVQNSTEIVLYDDAAEEQLAAANDLFGEFVITAPGKGERIEGVEVVLRLGTSFLGTGTDTANTLPSTTTSTTIG